MSKRTTASCDRLFDDLGAAFRELPPPVAGEPRHDMDYLTNFERKFRKEGRPIYRAAYQRMDTPLPTTVANDPGLEGPFKEIQSQPSS